MEISSLLNLEVVSENPARWYGLITDLKIRDNRIVSCVIKNGSRFTPSVFFVPEDIVRVEEEFIQITSEHAIRRDLKKDFEEKNTQTFSLIGTPVLDKYNVRFAKVVDAVFTKELKITHYILSRSFFDDIDFGFVIIAAEDLRAEPELDRLCYNRARNDLPEDPRQSGLMRKIFGIREEGR